MVQVSDTIEDRLAHRIFDGIIAKAAARIIMVAVVPFSFYLLNKYADKIDGQTASITKLEHSFEKSMSKLREQYAVLESKNELLHKSIDVKNSDQDRRLDGDERKIEDHEHRIIILERVGRSPLSNNP
jgi:hypothetical protein